MRTFTLQRSEDASGVSGIGAVAEGVVFWDGTVALRWRTEHRSTTVFSDIATVEAIHGHGGKTLVVFDAAGIMSTAGHEGAG
jgi:hypothetical protein